jgi:hypothetical protein
MMFEQTAEPAFQKQPKKMGEREVSMRMLIGCVALFTVLCICATGAFGFYLVDNQDVLAELESLFESEQVLPAGAIVNAKTIAFGQTMNGRHSSANNFEESWRFLAAGGDRVIITMRSESLDSYLYLYSSGSLLLEEDDDSGDGEMGYDAEITFTSPSDGVYYILADQFFEEEDSGSYTLTLKKE